MIPFWLRGFGKNIFVKTLIGDHRHVGVCNDNGNSCFHPTIDIAILYTGRDYGVNPKNEVKDQGPNPVDVEWLNNNVKDRKIERMVVHIPPSEILGLELNGIYDELVCCWGSEEEKNKDQDVIFNPKYTIFGHDHSNIGITEPHPTTGTKYVYGFKSGHHLDSYDGNFSPENPGYTLFQFEGDGEIVDVKPLTFDNYDLSHLYENKVLIDQSSCYYHVQHPGPTAIEIYRDIIIGFSSLLSVLLVAGVVFWCLYTRKRGRGKRVEETEMLRTNMA